VGKGEWEKVVGKGDRWWEKVTSTFFSSILIARLLRPTTRSEGRFKSQLFRGGSRPLLAPMGATALAARPQGRQLRLALGFIHQVRPVRRPRQRPIRAYSLREVLKSLAQRDAGHPLVAVFQPVLLSNEETLEKHAAAYYNQIRTSGLAEPVKTVLLDVFVNWLEKRLKHMGKKEIENMLFGELADLRETQSGKDLIQIGKEEGKIEGITEGKIKGKIEGKQEDLILALEARFGTVAPEVRQRVEQVQSVDKLRDLLLQVFKVNSIDELKW
jgi:hypothetical protein